MLRKLSAPKLFGFSRFSSIRNRHPENDFLCNLVLANEGIQDRVVLKMSQVYRHEFLPENVQEHAYKNMPLPIGFGQTCSQPLIVGLMTQVSDIQPSDVVLEIGSGCGYNAAVLSKFAKKVYSTEIIPQLCEMAKNNLKRLGFDNVEVIQSDGGYGLPEHAPFDVIMLTASVQNDIPKALFEQLKVGGRLVLPKLDTSVGHDRLIRITKIAENEYKEEHILDVRFVPLMGESSKIKEEEGTGNE
jgi:protein-L-isoaspartate(D-aspartate) O-methyltransferase